MAPQRGIVLVLLVVAVTRFFNHLGNPSWWSWMADLVHERRRGRFFGCRTQASSAVAAGCVLLGLTAVEFSGGMSNGRLLSGLFFLGAIFGVTDICLYFRIPEPPLARNKGCTGLRSFRRFGHRAYTQSRVSATCFSAWGSGRSAPIWCCRSCRSTSEARPWLGTRSAWE